jgi:hypothetical protein
VLELVSAQEPVLMSMLELEVASMLVLALVLTRRGVVER